MALAYLNDTVRMSVTFRNWSPSGGGQPDDPDTVTTTLIDLSDDSETSLTPLAGDGEAEYYADWTPDAIGDFRLRFIGVFSDDSTDVVDQDFTVLESESDADDATGSLGAQVEITFAAGLDPMYISSEELQDIFPDAPLLDIAEQIFIASTEVKSILHLADDETDIPLVALDYVKAAAACSLSKVFEGSDISTMSNFRLGDLQVTNQPISKSIINRGNASSWCELAFALRNEMINESTGMKAVVKGSAYRNPIPHRRIRSSNGSRH